MKKIVWWLSLAVVVTLFAAGPVARAEERERNMMERMERLEQHVQRLTMAMEHDKQERMNRPQEARGPMPSRPEMERSRPHVPTRPAMGEAKPTPVCPAPCSGAMRCLRCAAHALLAILVVLNILLAIWVYGDVQKRGVPGRGIFIVLVLLAGIPMSILYALVRIGDKVGEKSS
jgi:hypothetical protein